MKLPSVPSWFKDAVLKIKPQGNVYWKNKISLLIIYVKYRLKTSQKDNVSVTLLEKNILNAPKAIKIIMWLKNYSKCWI